MLSVVDLFAGCGGLGLGLEQAGFTTVFVNELHDDARATYLMNRRENEWLQDEKNQSSDIRELTSWPTPPGDGLLEAWKDVKPTPSALLLENVDRIRTKVDDVSLVTGGPPCQGFSGIGHRRTFALNRGDIPSNYLFRDMIAVIEAFAPRAFVFENVRGLLSARWHAGGRQGEIWEDVRRAFGDIEVETPDGHRVGYTIGYRLVRAKDYGIPQNRPRIILVGLREDLTVPDHPESSTDKTRGLIPLRGLYERAPDPEELWGDLADQDWALGGSSTQYNGVPPHDAHELVKALRRDPTDGSYLPNNRLTEQEYSRHSERVVKRFAALREAAASGGELPSHMQTKKFAQRVIPKRWTDGGPSITATSLPDDYVHYALNRAPTVREWARLQTFPDWYEFAGNRTTGGRRRAGDPSRGDWTRELPKYTQIGNAVPVELGRQIGLHLRRLVSETET